MLGLLTPKLRVLQRKPISNFRFDFDFGSPQVSLLQLIQAMHTQDNGGMSPTTCDIYLLSLVAKKWQAISDN